MFSPPEIVVTADTGNSPSTLAPAMNSGSCGPGTFEMNRLNGTPGTLTSRNMARAASPDSAVGSTADRSCRIVAGSASNASLATSTSSATASNRASGSAS